MANLSLVKKLKTTERHAVSFRAETYNLAGPIAPGPAVPITLVVGGVQGQAGVTVAVQ